MWSSSSKIEYSFIMLDWFKKLCIFIYLINWPNIYYFLITDFLIDFKEKTIPVFLCLATLTVPNLPLPNSLPS